MLAGKTPLLKAAAKIFWASSPFFEISSSKIIAVTVFSTSNDSVLIVSHPS